MASNDEGYKWKTQGNMELLNTWLPALADAGRRLYRAILPENKGNTLGEDRGEKLRAALHPNTIIQVNPILGGKVAVRCSKSSYGDCKLVANNLSLFANNLSRTVVLLANNLSQKSACLRTGAIMFASRNS